MALNKFVLAFETSVQSMLISVLFLLNKSYDETKQMLEKIVFAIVLSRIPSHM